MSGVKVAVRVRPFNSREIARDAESIITMDGATTSRDHCPLPLLLCLSLCKTGTRPSLLFLSPFVTLSLKPFSPGIKNPKAGNAADAIKSFNFDYSYWSKEVSTQFGEFTEKLGIVWSVEVAVMPLAYMSPIYGFFSHFTTCLFQFSKV